MDGATRAAGAVTGVRRAKNPVRLARVVMAETPHVMIGFAEADKLAAQHHLDLEEPDYFWTQSRWDSLQSELARIEQARQSSAAAAAWNDPSVPDSVKHGTVGAVALDSAGHLAAATSTGGRTAKYPGRIGGWFYIPLLCVCARAQLD